ncbi:MAG: FAD-binding protein [Christensenellales bacterium]
MWTGISPCARRQVRQGAFLSWFSSACRFPATKWGSMSATKRITIPDAATSAGPLTSRYMTEALEKSVRGRNIPMLNHTLIFRILTDQNGVCGLLGLDTHTRELTAVRCAHVILATGGPAGVYADRVYPESQFGMSGMAFAAGCRGANLHCWQYGLASVGFRWNVSGSYQQVIPRYVSVDRDGKETEFLSGRPDG